MLFVKAKLISNKQKYEYKTSETDGEPGDIEEGISFVPFDISESGF